MTILRLLVIRTLIGLGLSLLACCNQNSADFPSLLNIPVNPPAQPLIIAHRGSSRDAPENTLAAFQLAWEQGAEAIEGDFRLTSDGHVICFHDSDTERLTTDNIPIKTSTLSQLQELDIGSWKSPQYHAERIATLTQVLETIPDQNKKLILEIKDGPEIVPPIAKILNAAFLSGQLKPEQITIIAFDPEVIRAAKTQLPQLQANWLIDLKKQKRSLRGISSSAKILRQLKDIQADGASVNLPSENLANTLRADGKQLHVWTVNDPAQLPQLQQIGISSITTDIPAPMQAALDQLNTQQ